MNRYQLEHIIRASADIADDEEIIVIGSQSILGQYPNPPAELLVSMEADVYPKNHPERWELIDGSIGELSPFHSTFGYYAQGVEPGTAVLPEGWETRLVVLCNANTRGAKGLCLEAHDLAIAKLVANRDKDRAYLEAAARNQLIDHSTLLARLPTIPVDPEHRERIVHLVARIFRAARSPEEQG
ncbi:MAG: DUF6036 family nucleotidyltransferase [Deltaproteobacteria bacterium]|nr:DUF6036 family nucleotidyltransferase [Deltaproteobacteria bacterium]